MYICRGLRSTTFVTHQAQFQNGRIHERMICRPSATPTAHGALRSTAPPGNKSPSHLWLTSRRSTSANSSTARIQRYLIDLAEYDQAAETFERVLELDGENIIAPQTLTWMAEHRNDIVEAKRWLGRLLEVHPTNAEAQLVQQRLDEFQEVPAKRRRMRSGE